MSATKEDFRRLYAGHSKGSSIYKEAGLRFRHPIRRGGRQVLRRAWIGTKWPWLAEMIGQLWEWRWRRKICDREELCCLNRGHGGYCEDALTDEPIMPVGDG